MSNAESSRKVEREKPCEFCSGLIPEEARKCRYCGEWVGTYRQTPSIVKGSSSARAVSQGIKMKNFSRMAFKAKLYLLAAGLFAITVGVAGVVVNVSREINNPKIAEWISTIAGILVLAMWIIVPIIALNMMTQTYYKE